MLVRFGTVRSIVSRVPVVKTISIDIVSRDDNLSESLNMITINACSPESIISLLFLLIVKNRIACVSSVAAVWLMGFLSNIPSDTSRWESNSN
ncbi:MAG: hypothetical protein HRO68_06665 [Nitrosopumilus sp.]|nr:hypothetical protein [Nitrosopumilus sp.]